MKKLTKLQVVKYIINNIKIYSKVQSACSLDCPYLEHHKGCCILTNYEKLKHDEQSNLVRTKACLALKPLVELE